MALCQLGISDAPGHTFGLARQLVESQRQRELDEQLRSLRAQNQLEMDALKAKATEVLGDGEEKPATLAGPLWGFHLPFLLRQCSMLRFNSRAWKPCDENGIWRRISFELRKAPWWYALLARRCTPGPQPPDVTLLPAALQHERDAAEELRGRFHALQVRQILWSRPAVKPCWCGTPGGCLPRIPCLGCGLGADQGRGHVKCQPGGFEAAGLSSATRQCRDGRATPV
jgi:hypothetical protein